MPAKFADKLWSLEPPAFAQFQRALPKSEMGSYKTGVPVDSKQNLWRGKSTSSGENKRDLAKQMIKRLPKSGGAKSLAKYQKRASNRYAPSPALDALQQRQARERLTDCRLAQKTSQAETVLTAGCRTPCAPSASCTVPSTVSYVVAACAKLVYRRCTRQMDRQL